ncbi:amino acid adenylation domain-containing protein [Leptolyngbya cf. ectocarpi LEGE 11479]|uniref:Amino acid adenylation domain-containing protein n=1 Tax=Leptolyngbya cf. ectocarpi LEGE 11479 TaxID=1828722 RepID=A0A928ZSP8_LEPEC|nr:non-ribosomal peptide synthetase [Leptolyngbya ectocarpi]MBE9065561.1 amino acid adenylation domain-containing protein [Leptolyngbya cf. ectocarpi LEGE 11479]
MKFRTVPVGRPVINTQIYILDTYLNLVPVGIEGELYVAGVGVGRGYLNRSGLTDERFIPNPFSTINDLNHSRLYKTGDRARYLPNGTIEFLGRIDHQVKVRGFRIELGEIEAALLSHSHVQQAVVIDREDNLGDKRLVAYMVCEAPLPACSTNWSEFLKAQLPSHMIPSAFVELEALPLTPNGKLDRRALPMPDTDLREAANFVAPRTPTEEITADIFAAVLGLETIGIHSNFFEFGGHSLLATQAISKLRGAFQVELPLRDLFEAPTVAELDQRIHQALTCEQSQHKLVPITAISREKSFPFPLSWSQERLWFLNQLEGASRAYNIPIVLKVEGSLNLDALAWAMQSVAERHEILRTTFHNPDGQPIQIVSPTAACSIPLEDFTTVPMEQQQDRVHQRIHQAATTPFNLTEGPLLRISLLHLFEKSYVLLLVFHHSIFDAWSGEVFVRELTTFYQVYQSQPAKVSPFPPLTHQYGDYAYWQRQHLNVVLEPQLKYWQQHLSGTLPALNFPTDYPQSAQPEYQGARCSRQLSVSLSTALKTLCREEDVTLFMALLAALNLLLARHTDQTDIIIGAPIAGRQHPGTENLIGFFVNLLPLRIDLSEIITFRELLAHVRDVTLAAYSNQDVPFEKLVEVLQPERALNRHPVFDVMLNFLQTSMAPPKVSGLELTPLEMPDMASKFWLTLHVREQENCLQLELAYRQSLFSAERMEIFLAQFETLLEQIVSMPNQAVHRYSLLVANPPWKLPDPSVPLVESPFEPVSALVMAQVRKHPDKTAITQAGQCWTYQDLMAEATRVADRLIDTGAQSGDVVAVYGERNFEFISSILGIFLSGTVLLTLDSNLPEQRLRLMVEQAKVRYLVILDNDLPRQWVPDPVHLLMEKPTVKSQQTAVKSAAMVSVQMSSLPQVKGDDPAYIFFTSGSTGIPKGVLGLHKGISHFVNWQRDTFEVGSEDRVAQLIRLSFDALLRDIFLPLTSGATLCLPTEDELSRDRILHWLEQENISILHTVPTVAQFWIANAPNIIKLPALRLAFFSGEPLTANFISQWRQTFTPAHNLINLYGATETTMVKTYYLVPQHLRPGSQPAGWPLPQTQTWVLRDNDQPCGIGEVGQIVVRTPFRTLGYINADSGQPPCFRPNPFRYDPDDLVYDTGDRGRFLPDGSLEVLGRLDSQLKIRGVRIQPGEIEAILNQDSDIDQSVVVARPDAKGENVLIAYLVPRHQTDIDRHQLHNSLFQRLPVYLIPTTYVILDTLPLTPSGKVDRSALPIPDLSISTLSTQIPPRTPTEISLVEIVANILRLDTVGIYDNFFALGGHSLQASQVIAYIQQTFGIKLPLRSLFEEPTVAALAKMIDIYQEKGNTNAASTTPIPKRSRRRVKRSAEGTLIIPAQLKQELQDN